MADPLKEEVPGVGKIDKFLATLSPKERLRFRLMAFGRNRKVKGAAARGADITVDDPAKLAELKAFIDQKTREAAVKGLIESNLAGITSGENQAELMKEAEADLWLASTLQRAKVKVKRPKEDE